MHYLVDIVIYSYANLPVLVKVIKMTQFYQYCSASPQSLQACFYWHSKSTIKSFELFQYLIFFVTLPQKRLADSFGLLS